MFTSEYFVSLRFPFDRLKIKYNRIHSTSSLNKKSYCKRHLCYEWCLPLAAQSFPRLIIIIFRLNVPIFVMAIWIAMSLRHAYRIIECLKCLKCIGWSLCKSRRICCQFLPFTSRNERFNHYLQYMRMIYFLVLLIFDSIPFPSSPSYLCNMCLMCQFQSLFIISHRTKNSSEELERYIVISTHVNISLSLLPLI